MYGFYYGTGSIKTRCFGENIALWEANLKDGNLLEKKSCKPNVSLNREGTGMQVIDIDVVGVEEIHHKEVEDEGPMVIQWRKILLRQICF